jgi:hypothetical protein
MPRVSTSRPISFALCLSSFVHITDLESIAVHIDEQQAFPEHRDILIYAIISAMSSADSSLVGWSSSADAVVARLISRIAGAAASSGSRASIGCIGLALAVAQEAINLPACARELRASAEQPAKRSTKGSASRFQHRTRGRDRAITTT